MKNIKWTVIGFIALVASIAGAFLLGKFSGNPKVEQNYNVNKAFVRRIVEMGTLEEQGTASYEYHYTEEGNGMMANLKNLVLEKHITMRIPYIAKYGVMLQDDSMRIDVDDKANRVSVSLPEPVLISYQLVMDKVQQSADRGWLVFKSDMTSAISETYASGIAAASADAANVSQSEANVVELLKGLYPGRSVSVTFHRPLKKTVPIQG